MRSQYLLVVFGVFFFLMVMSPSNVAETDAATSYYTEFGLVRYLGAGQYQYHTKIGMRNTWNGNAWVPYIVSGNTVYFAGSALNVYDYYASLDYDGRQLIADMHWEVEQNVKGRWRVLNLWERTVLSPVETSDKVVIGNSMTDGFSFMNVTYAIRANDLFKVTVNFLPYEAGEYRFVWSMTGIQGDIQEANESIAFSDVQIGFNDLIESNMTYVYDWAVAEKKLDIVIGSVMLGANQHFVIDPSVNPVLGADGDDDCWLYQPGPSHYTALIYTDLTWVTSTGYTPQYRFALAIPKDATILSANLSLYEVADTYDYADSPTIWRLNEDNVGSLEADTVYPSRANTTTCSWVSPDAIQNEWETAAITTLVQEQVNLAGWDSGYYIGLRMWWAGTHTIHYKIEDYQNTDTHNAYLNITYSEGGGNNAPVNDGCVLTNPDDTDNLYANYKEYIFTSNVSDADGFADIDYTELSAYSGAAYWTVRYDEDSDTFSEELGASYIVLGGSSSASEGSNNIDVTWYITIEWSHGDLTNYDLRSYVVDDEPESDTDEYDLNYDYETRLDFTTGPTLSDGLGTVDRGDYNTVDSITASGTVDYYGSAISPASDEVDIWALCSDVAGSPWSDLTLTDGAFSMTLDSDDQVGLDTYDFKAVVESGGSGSTDLCHTTHSDSYISDRLVVLLSADDYNVINGVQVNITISVVYDYDDTTFDAWILNITNDALPWYIFTFANGSLCHDTDTNDTNIYTAVSCLNESLHGVTLFTSNSISITWSAVPTTTTTTTTTIVTNSIFYQLFLTLDMWGFLGPFALLIGGYLVARKNNTLAVLWFIAECLVIAHYFTLVSATPQYWWHIFILLIGGLFTCIYPLWDR